MKILHLEDNAADAGIVSELIRGKWPDAEIELVPDREAFLQAVSRERFDLVLSDYTIPGFDGIDALTALKHWAPDTPFLFVSGTVSEDLAIEALRLGADDYVLKDRLKRLLVVVPRALEAATQRRQHRLAESRVRELAQMLDQAREAIFVTDLINRVLYWNTGAERVFGWSSAEAVGRSLDELLACTTGAEWSRAHVATVETGQWAGELLLHNRSQQPVSVEMRQSLVREESGAAKACLCICTDITDRKRLEEQFLRAQRMENLGLLAAGIAHDLNNMLAPILLATPILQDSVSDPGARKLLETLERSAERGAQLVRQILSFAQGVEGEQHLLQVKHLLRDISSVVNGTFPKSIRHEFYVPSELWPINGNPTQIHQVLLNLCVNARDAMPNGGTLRIQAGNVHLDPVKAAAIPCARPGSFLVVTVSDTGSGIAPEIQKRIWEPFFTTKEAGRGTGLGLSTVLGIVRSHHGFVDVVTQVGAGSAFRVYLPAASSALPTSTEAPFRSLPVGKGELILVVDDEKQVRDMISQVLGRHGYRVLTAPDGVEATAIFAQKATEIQLVISDLHMPQLDGAMLGRALRKINPRARMLVVSGMASGLGNRADFHPQDFADALLLKPFRAETLLETVHEILTAARPAPFVVR